MNNDNGTRQEDRRQKKEEIGKRKGGNMEAWYSWGGKEKKEKRVSQHEINDHVEEQDGDQLTAAGSTEAGAPPQSK